MGEFTHFNGQGEAIMVDVSEKQDTVREATASGRIRMSEECYAKVKAGDMKKGDVLGVARIAGIMGTKKTSELIPLCHILNISKAEVEFIVQRGLEVIPVEVKSGTSVTGRSLIEYNKRYSPGLRIRYSMLNLKRDDSFINIPLFLADRTEKLIFK